VDLLALEIDGRAAAEGELRHLALVNYAHFTAMQVRGQAVRGLELHLERLDAATGELYGTGLDGDRVRGCIRHALGGQIGDATVRVTVFQPDPARPPSVLVAVRGPAEAPTAPQRLRSVRYQRPVAHIKHTGMFAQIHYGLRAERDGFDDAVFTSGDGIVSEAAIANLGGCRNGTVTWPDAPVLPGITMLLLDRYLPAAGLTSRRGTVRLGGLGGFGAVFLTNSLGVSPVGRVDGETLDPDPGVMKTIIGVYAGIPWDPI
jgi:branched-subunit amino acid aminotransferase/4-amino-4-deoxychorismate lyase